MAKFDFLKTATRAFNRIGFKLHKHSPEILVVGGAIGTVVGTVMACKATTKVPEIVNGTKKKVTAIREYAATPEVIEGGMYTEQDRKKDIAIVYVRAGLDLLKTYGPSVLVYGTSLGCMLKSHNIIHRRNIALAAAYATVDKSFKEYRGNVIERFGEELDKELKYNIKSKEIEEIVVDEEGNQTVVKKTVNTASPVHSEYAIFFDETCRGWTKNAEANKVFILQVQNWANERLQARGHLFLNEVLDELGVDRTQAGNQVGWLYDEKGIDCGDNYVDFRVFDQCGIERYDERKRAFVNGHERSIILDPNVDGVILDRLP